MVEAPVALQRNWVNGDRMTRSRPHDDAMAELYRSDPALALEVIQGIVADGDHTELPSVLRQAAQAFGGVERSPIIDFLRGELAALCAVDAVRREAVQAFEALLAQDGG